MKFKRILLCSIFVLTLGFCLASCKKSVSYEVIFQTGEGEVLNKLTLTEAGKISEPETPTKEGYIFMGWYKDSRHIQEWNFSRDVVSSSTTIYAKWEKVLTCAEANKLCEPAGYQSKGRYYIRGTVVAVTNPTYGEMTIQDDTGSLYVYGTYSSDGELRYSELEDKPYAGDEVLLYGLLENYNGKPELKSAWIKEVVHKDVEFNESDYEAMSIADARMKAKGTKVILSGVVAKISYANGKVPSGFYLVDNSNSIYVYDSQITARVAIGNKVKIAAEKDYWILETEQTNASKFGYEGCCQVSNVHLLENDNGNTVFDKSWIKASTIKEIMDTPVTENITTTIYKVNALVYKAEGTGFVNYYFNDIDGVTGSYTYTQCNGSDFDWLDEFDGKICTVYLSPINAKSSASGCSWRFFPIEVIDEGYTFDKSTAPSFAVKYYGVGQFLTEYSSDPKLELITTVSSDLLGISNIELTYFSSDTSVLSFDLEENKLMMHTHSAGIATVTITASYEGHTYSETVKISCVEVEIPDTITVQEAIAADPENGGTEVTVRGIVGPSLVNRDGFYLIDSTGVIAITTSKDNLALVHLGNEIIVKGTRTLFGHEGSFYGQSVLLDCELIMNFYGEHDYSTSTFDDSKTLDDLLGMNVSEDHTTQVYVVEVQVKLVDTAYYSNLYILSPTTGKQMVLYSSSSNQYNWLKKYAGENGEPGETITVEIALCNWNKKSQFPGCVLAVLGENGQKEVNVLNFSK